MTEILESMAAAKLHHRAGRLDEAERIYRQVLLKDGTNAPAWHFLGVVAWQKGELDSAAQYIGQALKLTENYSEAHYNLGLVRQAQNRLDEAAKNYGRALQLEPQFVESWINLGKTHSEQKDFDQATACYLRAIDLDPSSFSALSNLGDVYREQGRLDESVTCCRKALYLQPMFAEGHNNLGLALQEQGNVEAALESYKRAIELKPDYVDARFNRSTLLLQTGDFENGWIEYEWRWKQPTYLVPRSFRQPSWNGEDLAGKTILLEAEQGLGDTIQFIRYAPLVKRLGANVVVLCQESLARILVRCPGVDRLISSSESLSSFDVEIPLLSVPRVLGTTATSVPRNVPYIFPDDALVSYWREKLASIRRLRVGINWRGTSETASAKRRNIPVQHFEWLAQVTGVQLINLQRDALHSEREELTRHRIHQFGDETDRLHGAFMDTAAIMANLDLVITSDTSIAHLAGSLGVPVWVFLPFAASWHWMLARFDSPWYPTMRLFRQRARGDWNGVFDEIRTELVALLSRVS